MTALVTVSSATENQQLKNKRIRVRGYDTDEYGNIGPTPAFAVILEAGADYSGHIWNGRIVIVDEIDHD